ncbi:MAG: hypothetical protein U0572_06260 [Phycisphaerales bacterium]
MRDGERLPKIPSRVGGLALAALLAGCTARALVPGPDDAYRDQIRKLEAEVAALKASNVELRKGLAAARSASPLDAEIAAETPRAVGLAIAWGSAIEEDPNDPARAKLSLYLEPRDARGRFVQVAGSLSVSVVSIPNPGDGEPVRVGAVTLSPKELRDAWRSGMLGTHYTVEVPLDFSKARDTPAAGVSIELVEGGGAQPLTTTTTLDITPSKSAVRQR